MATIVDCLRESAKSLECNTEARAVSGFFKCLGRERCFWILPTGFGKSMCFQCLPQAYDLLRRTSGSVVLVVCRLVAIMED